MNQPEHMRPKWRIIKKCEKCGAESEWASNWNDPPENGRLDMGFEYCGADNGTELGCRNRWYRVVRSESIPREVVE